MSRPISSVLRPVLALIAGGALACVAGADEPERAATEKRVAAWTAALKDKDATIRSQAADSLGRVSEATKSGGELIGTRLTPAAHALLDALKDTDGRVRIAAATAVARISRAATPEDNRKLLGALLDTLKDSERDVRAAATGALANFRSAEKSSPEESAETRQKVFGALVIMTRDKDSSVRVAAVSPLALVLPWDASQAHRVAGAALGDALTDSRAEVRLAAAISLGGLNPKQLDEDATGSLGTALLKRFADADPKVRGAAAVSATHLITNPKVVLNPLTELLKDGDEGVRACAAQSLSRVRPAAEAVPALTAALEDASASVRANAAYSLAGAGESAKPAVPRLLTLLKDENAGVREQSVVTLCRIPSEAKATLPALIDALQDARTRYAVAFALGDLGAAGKPAVPALLKQFNDPKSNAREPALRSLGRIDPEDKDVIAAHIEGLSDRDGDLSDAALDLFVAQGAKAKAAVPALLAAYTGEKATPGLRGGVARALGKIGPAAQPAVPVFLEVLRNEKAPLRQRVDAINGLRLLGPVAKEAVPTLSEMLKHKDEGLRRAAAYALSKIDPEMGKKPPPK